MAIELLPTADNSERIAELQRKLKAREGMKGYERNCAELKAEIERLRS